MIISFTWPSPPARLGGVVALFEFANALARRGHEVHFIHGPATPDRIRSIDELDWFPFAATIEHHIVDRLDDPLLPVADVAFSPNGPRTLGNPAIFIQGFRMLPDEYERAFYRSRGPKVCIASWLVDVGKRFGARPEQLWHVPMGLDHRLFSLQVPLGERPYDVAVLHHLHPTKGWEVGIAALREARRRVPDLRALVFSAADPIEPLDDWIDLRVGLQHETLATEVYNASKVFMQASYFEGFGFTAIEAMACGAALVTSENGGSRDYAVPGETAWVAPSGDAAGLADGIVTLLGDRDQRIRLATAGERFVQRFEWDAGAELLERHLEDYLADPAALQLPPFPVAERSRQ